MKIGDYDIRLTLTVTKNLVNEREIIRMVNKVVPKNAKDTYNHILRVKEIYNHPEFWGDQPHLSLADAKKFANEHWPHWKEEDDYDE